MNKKDVGFLMAGLGLGAAVALLYAPRSGKVTRRFVRVKAGSGVRYARVQGEDLKSAAVERFEKGKKVVRETRSNLEAAIQAGREAYRDAQVG